jgi:hypothetical protein
LKSRSSLFSAETVSSGKTSKVALLLRHSIEHVLGVGSARLLGQWRQCLGLHRTPLGQ